MQLSTCKPTCFSRGYLTDAGPSLIEGNTANVGVRSLQVHRPLLRDPRVRRFFEFHEVVEAE